MIFFEPVGVPKFKADIIQGEFHFDCPACKKRVILPLKNTNTECDCGQYLGISETKKHFYLSLIESKKYIAQSLNY